MLVESRGPFAQAAVALSVALAADGVDRQARAVERRPRELVEGVVRDVQPVEVRQLLGREILRQLAELVVGQIERGHRSRVFAGERPFGDFVDHVAAQDDVCDERSRRAETFGELRELVRRERELFDVQALERAVLFAFEAVNLVVGEIDRFDGELALGREDVGELREFVVGRREGLDVVHGAEKAVPVGGQRREFVVVEVELRGSHFFSERMDGPDLVLGQVQQADLLEVPERFRHFPEIVVADVENL